MNRTTIAGLAAALFLVSCGGDGPEGTTSSSLATRQAVSTASIQLTVATTGTGTGTITSSDGSINCGTVCSAAVATPVTLMATPEFGSLFNGWSGACTGLGACVIDGDAAQSVTANFVPATTTLQMPWFTKHPGYISRFVLLNSGATDATYNVVVRTEPGNTALVRPAYTSGTIKAGTQLVLNVDDIVESFSAGQRGFAFIATSAMETAVSGIYNLVQPSTGSISNVSLLSSSDAGSSTTLVAPWVTVDDAYRGDLILTNQRPDHATATITYLAPNGGSVVPKVSNIVIPARGQILVDGASLATPYGGTSFGAVLTVNAPPSHIKGTYKIFRKSTGAASSTELTMPAVPTVSTALTVPWFSTAPGYESRFILTNRSASPVSYTINVLPEPGNALTLGTLTGSIPANGQTIVPASSVLLATTTATRASAVFEIAASADVVDGIYQIVSSGTGAISNTVMARQASRQTGTSALLLPWFSTATGYISRMTLLNTSDAAAPYTIYLAVEQGNYVTQLLATSGTIPARSLKVIPMSDVVVGFTGATRASAIVRVQAAPSQVHGLYNIVNPTSGSISNTLMVHAPAETTVNPPSPLPPAPNAVPVASAGPDRNVATGTVVTLDGSGSSDANGDPLTHNWTLASKPAGSSATLSGATTVKPSFVADLPGTYVASLVVSDGKASSTPSNVAVAAATPQLKLYALDAFFGDRLVSWPYNSSAAVNATVTCVGSGCPIVYDIATFKLEVADAAVTITNLRAENLTSGSTIQPSFSGLTNNQVILAGQSATFKLQSQFTKYSTVLMRYSFDVAETGESFIYTVQLRTN